MIEVETAFTDFAFEPLDELVVENMLNKVHGPIHMRRRDVRAGDQILLPEHVVPMHTASSLESAFGQRARSAERTCEPHSTEHDAEREVCFGVLLRVFVFGLEDVVDRDANAEC